MFEIFDVMFEVSSLSIIIAAISVVIGVVFAVLQLRNLVRARQTDLVVGLYQLFGGKEFLESWQTVVLGKYKDYNDFSKKARLEGLQIATFYEGLGVLFHRKLADIGLVSDLFPVKMAWEKLKPIAEEQRKRLNEPRVFEWFEHLYNEVHKREQKLQQTQQ